MVGVRGRGRGRVRVRVRVRVRARVSDLLEEGGDGEGGVRVLFARWLVRVRVRVR